MDASFVRKCFLAGANAIDAKKEVINDLNVFPVPDGDTGTNMTMTIMSAAKEVAALENPDMKSLGKAISGGSLRGKLNGVKVDYWTPFNPSNKFPRPSYSADPAYLSAIAIQDASYIRLRTLQLGYTFPTRLLKNTPIHKLRLYATATNLLTFTEFKSYSPELTPGSYPESRQYVFGVNVSF